MKKTMLTIASVLGLALAAPAFAATPPAGGEAPAAAPAPTTPAPKVAKKKGHKAAKGGKKVEAKPQGRRHHVKHKPHGVKTAPVVK